MRDQQGLQLPADRVDTTTRTECGGNPEHTLKSGKRARLRTPRGLTGQGQRVPAPRDYVEVLMPRLREAGFTGTVLTYRGKEYFQKYYKRALYPANMWLTYRGLRYRPAALQLNASNDLVDWNGV